MDDAILDFEPAMTEAELVEGEKLHLTLEAQRSDAMRLGLTLSGSKIRQLYESEPATVLNCLEKAVESFDHYTNTMDLLSGAIARLYAVAQEAGFSQGFGDSYTATRALEIISERPADGPDNPTLQ